MGLTLVFSKKPVKKMDLGDLVTEMNRIQFENSYVVLIDESNISDVPSSLRKSFRRYHAIRKQLNEKYPMLYKRKNN
ncbi:MAG: hypothetical protein WD876_00485 [Candidatus Pacearchaeota archaeon]